MPRKGYKSITIPEKVYDYLFKEYMKEKDAMERKGVRSFSGYISAKLDKMIEIEKQRNP